MCQNNCEICQHDEDTKKAMGLLRVAIEKSIYALMVKTEKAYEEELVARAEFRDFVESHPHIHLSLA